MLFYSFSNSFWNDEKFDYKKKRMLKKRVKKDFVEQMIQSSNVVSNLMTQAETNLILNVNNYFKAQIFNVTKFQKYIFN